MLEEVALYRPKSRQELIHEQIYSFTDRGDREVAIRPEMTLIVARMFIVSSLGQYGGTQIPNLSGNQSF